MTQGDGEYYFGTSPNTRHTYQTAGSYTVRLYAQSVPGNWFAETISPNIVRVEAPRTKTYQLVVNVFGYPTAIGSVKSTDGIIDCDGSICGGVGREFTSGSVVTLVATPRPGTIFTGWGGACTGTGACTVTMNEAKNVTATFSASTASLPTCTLTASPPSISVGGSSSLSAVCTLVPTSYSWVGGSCGGNTSNSCTVTPSSTTSYTVMAQNAYGWSNAASTTVTVNAPIVTSVIKAGFTASPRSGTAPLTVSFNASAGSSNTNDTLNYTWDFGDGTTGIGANIQHIYKNIGNYKIGLNVNNGKGQGASATDTVIVNPKNISTDVMDIYTKSIRSFNKNANDTFATEFSPDSNGYYKLTIRDTAMPPPVKIMSKAKIVRLQINPNYQQDVQNYPRIEGSSDPTEAGGGLSYMFYGEKGHIYSIQAQFLSASSYQVTLTRQEIGPHAHNYGSQGRSKLLSLTNKSVFVANKKWPKNNLKVAIRYDAALAGFKPNSGDICLNDDSDIVCKSKVDKHIFDAISQFSAVSSLTFSPSDWNNADIRVSVCAPNGQLCNTGSSYIVIIQTPCCI